ncbi:MAG TPA: phosphoribosylamine--glycine ligase [Candidatus Limnocylindrales bacterium]|nr:phosphoribosylamine--glycine ligase [Candidatus Limnocylindrales bacterium]
MSGLRVLVVGGGAREHALAWRLSGEAAVERVMVAPGNPLMSDVADVRPDVDAADHEALIRLCRAARVDLVVVGPEAPLVDGIVDALTEAEVPCFGPTAAAARLEGSKAFAREVCRAAGVPMAQGRAFVDARAAIEYAETLGLPVVVKADGLAAGKGVSICATLAEAERVIRESLEGSRFGRAGQTVVVERWLAGREASVIAICDGATAVILPAARDHKRLREGEQGPNTGGMGAYSPIDELDDTRLADLAGRLFVPVLAAMAARGTPYRGALFAGLMLSAEGPRLLEFNARFGDPETQAILPRLAVPLAPLLVAAVEGRLAAAALELGIAGGLIPTLADAAVAITLATEGYPAGPRTGDAISGIAEATASGALVFGAGVGRDDGEGLVTAGGRVVTVVGRGADLAGAAEAAYEAAGRIDFSGRVMRRDIGGSLAEVAA